MKYVIGFFLTIILYAGVFALGDVFARELRDYIKSAYPMYKLRRNIHAARTGKQAADLHNRLANIFQTRIWNHNLPANN